MNKEERERTIREKVLGNASSDMTREEAIARIQEHMIAHKMKEPRAILITKALDMAVNALKQEPREHGEWIETGYALWDGNGNMLYECMCNECNGLAYFRKESLKHTLVGAKCCPNCGAKMRGTKLPHTDKSGLEYADQPTLRSAT